MRRRPDPRVGAPPSGNGHGHLHIFSHPDCDRPVKGGTTVIAFVEDPDGYKVELIEKHA
ncbi:MAG: Lactoylglutathione lyase (EC [uncultured Caballeronia sp.]|nr:MAG: Lactoylglutathione lyase (EC [uncultured Caballeronia sp.]